MVEMPESSRFAAVELGLGDGAGLEGRASVDELERATLATGAGDRDSSEGAGGGRPGAGETTEGRPIDDGQGWDAEEGDEAPPREGRGLGEPPRRRSRAPQALREGDTSP